VNNQLYIYADSTAANDGSTLSNDGVISIQAGPVQGTELLTALGITATEYAAPQYLPSYSYEQPKWITAAGVANARPTGSVWQNLSSANNGLFLSVKSYSAALGTWISQSAPAYVSDVNAIYALDPTGGGKNIPVGTTYLAFDTSFYVTTPLATCSFELYDRYAIGATVITGTTIPTGNAFTVANSFVVTATEAGSTTQNTATVTIGGTGTVANFISAVSAANIPYVSASVNSTGSIVFTQSQGGAIYLVNGSFSGANPITTAGFTTATAKCRADQVSNSLVLSNWVSLLNYLKKC
jgi:hypothetical protein